MDIPNGAIVILGDGETYASLADCSVAILTPEGLDELDHNGILSEIEPWNVIRHTSFYTLFKEGNMPTD